MSSSAIYIDVNSYVRDSIYRNPFEFYLESRFLNHWVKIPRDNLYTPNIFMDVKLKYLIIPFREEFANYNRLYIQFGTEPFGSYYISGLTNCLANSGFIARFEKTQTDFLNNRKWIHFTGNDIIQKMNFDVNKSPKLLIMDEFGKKLFIDDIDFLIENQISLLFELNQTK